MSEDFKKYGELFLVDEEHFGELFSLLKSVKFKRSDFFLQEGEKCQYLGFVESGTMRSYYVNEDGVEKKFRLPF